ncbi:hypothetical protein RCIX2699 [Methanocella arvoryzae MRE50]|uniref:Uncharacterized protein n=2 Tax=Methanocella TaxID=570266 RepID=Q0W1K1_METAR|nr:hypothetical protein RCIX2699 [Methanocella arvoryzae MRE50]
MKKVEMQPPGESMMRRIIIISVLIILLSHSVVGIANAAGSGVKVFAPTETFIEADTLPYTYNSSFVVLNDGQQDGVYVIRVTVDDPVAITWINVTPAAFVLSPGESKLVHFEINISNEQAKTGKYNIIFTPTLLPRNVEPYLDTFAQYVSIVDYYNLTLVVPPINGFAAGIVEGGTPVVFQDIPGRVNLVQYSRPLDGNRDVIEIDRAIRINAPTAATVQEPTSISLSVFEGLSNRGIDLIAVSPEGIFYPITSEDFTFTSEGKWGIIATAGDQMLLGKPITINKGGAQLVMPGMDTILAAISFILLLSIVPIWFLTRRSRTDPYQDITFKAYVIRKYIDHFDSEKLKRAVGYIEDEYYDLISKDAPGDREQARASIDELRTLTRLES